MINILNKIAQIERKDKILFYISYVLFILATIVFESTEFRNIEMIGLVRKILNVLIYTLLFAKIVFFTKYNKQDITKILIISSCFFISAILSGDNILFKTTLFVVGAKNINLRKLIKVDMALKIMIVISIVTLSLTGIINNYTEVRDGSEVLRYSLGFTHPNILASFVMVLILEWIYLIDRKKKFFEYIVVFLLILIVGKITDSRTSSIIMILSLFLSFILASDNIIKKMYLSIKKRIKREYILENLPIMIFLFCIIISIFVSANYNPNNKFMFYLNKLISGRLYLANIFINKYGFSIIGQKVEFISTRMAREQNITAAVLDNAYVNLPLVYGIIPMIIFCIGYIILMKKLAQEKSYNLLICILMFIILGLMERNLMNLHYNFTILFLSTILYSNYSMIRINIKQYINLR
jgi:hypothetical protein